MLPASPPQVPTDFQPQPLRFSLDLVTIPNPCPVSWESMQGNARVRFCGECRLNVYNLSEMTRPEAEQLIEQHQGRLCVNFYQRSDGTILTQSCSRALRALQASRRWFHATVIALVTLVCWYHGYFCIYENDWSGVGFSPLGRLLGITPPRMGGGIACRPMPPRPGNVPPVQPNAVEGD